MKFTNMIYGWITFFVILVCSVQVTLAQQTPKQRPVEAILASADSLLSITDYVSDPPNKSYINSLIKRLDEIVTEINAYKNRSKASAEKWASEITKYLVNLDLRRKHYMQTRDGESQLPPKTEEEKRQRGKERELFRCQRWLEMYLDDTTATAFVENPNPEQLADQQEFLDQLIQCLEMFVSDAVTFRKTQKLITRLFVHKRIPYELLQYFTSSQITNLLKSFTEDTTFTAIAEYVIQAEDPQRTLSLLKKLVESGDQQVLNRMFETLLEESYRDPQKLLALEGLILKWMRDKDEQQYLKPLLYLLQRVHNEQVLAILFRQVAEKIPAPTEENYEEVLNLIEDDLFKNKKVLYSDAARLEVLVKHAANIASDKTYLEEKMIIFPFYRTGDKNIDFSPIHFEKMTDQLVAVFSNSFKIERQTDPHLFRTGELSSSPPFYMIGAMEIPPEGRSIKLHFRFYDGIDDLLLVSYEEVVQYSDNYNTLNPILNSVFEKVSQRFLKLLTACQHFEDIAQTALPRLIDRGKLRSYLYRKSYFNVQIDSAFAEERWAQVKEIFVANLASPLETPATVRNWDTFVEQLITRIGGNFEPWFPVVRQQPGTGHLRIDGIPNDNPDAYDIEIKIGLEQVLVITLNFPGLSSTREIQDLQMRSSIQFVVETLNYYLGVNTQLLQQTFQDSIKNWQKRSLGLPSDSEFEKPAVTNAIPSLFLAGSSQFLLAKHKRVSWKNWRYAVGAALMAGQVFALGKAANLNNEGIKLANDPEAANRKLDQRDQYLYFAIGTVSLSTIIGLLDIFL